MDFELRVVQICYKSYDYPFFVFKLIPLLIPPPLAFTSVPHISIYNYRCLRHKITLLSFFSSSSPGT